MRNMKKIIIMAIIMVAAVLVLSGCESRPIEGYVVGKAFVPAHTLIHNAAMHTTTFKHYPDQWFVWIADSNHVERCRVDRHTFQRLKRGQYVKSKGTYYGKESNKTAD